MSLLYVEICSCITALALTVEFAIITSNFTSIV